MLDRYLNRHPLGNEFERLMRLIIHLKDPVCEAKIIKVHSQGSLSQAEIPLFRETKHSPYTLPLWAEKLHLNFYFCGPFLSTK